MSAMDLMPEPRVLAVKKVPGTVAAPRTVYKPCPKPEPLPYASDSDRYARIGEIIDAACTVFGISNDEIRSKCRHKKIVLAREIIVTLARTHTTLSLPEINSHIRPYAHTCHSTSITAYQRFVRTNDDIRMVEGIAKPKWEWLATVEAVAIAKRAKEPAK